MLKSLDIVIAFSVIMLVVSMSVTLITEWFLRLLGMRGKKLLAGVADLLNQIDPHLLTQEHASEIARKVLEHPLAAAGGSRLAEVIQREDLVKIVMQIAASAAARMPQPAALAAAAGGGAVAPAPAPPTGPQPSPAEQALVQALSNAGIANPAATLDSVRMFSMRLEASRPELATHVREATAIITEAESQFVAKVNGWFDQTMERVSRSFTGHSRYWTVGISLILAFGLQLDAIQLINRLSVDDALRNSLLTDASKFAPAPTDKPEIQQQTRDNVAQLQRLATDQLIAWPPFHNWKGSPEDFKNLPGILLAGLFISLGAPFWFKILGDLLKLRPSLAAKEDAQRAERQTTQQPPVLQAILPTASGEQGDLAAG
jgi:hypothetical protein